MKILILGDAPSSHIVKWANGLFEEGHEIIIFSLLRGGQSQYKNGIKIIYLESSSRFKLFGTGSLFKVFYLLAFPALKRLIKEIQPDILHAHYASSYGLLGALSKFHPFILSIWGGDVFSFPKKSVLHRYILNYNLRAADKILSTSQIMAKEIKKYTNKEIIVTPFGIDINTFKPGDKADTIMGEYDFIIGTIKGLEEIYGIEYLIEAYCIVRTKLRDVKIKLLIVGGGSQKNKINKLIIEKKLSDDIILAGKIDYSEIHKYHNLLNIYIALSIFDESFGVAILEASACGKPVIVSDVGGLPEVVDNEITGYIVPVRDAESAAEKIIELINDEKLRNDLGKAGRERVVKFYNWDDSVQQMITIYKSVT